MSLNLVVQDGVVKSPTLRYSQEAKPELRFTLIQQDGQWPLFLPCCAVGSAAERLAGELEDDMHIIVTSGKLCYRKRDTKLGEQSRMEILVWQVEKVRAPESPPDERSEADAMADTSAGEIAAPEPKPHKRGYPKAALGGGFVTN